MKHLICAFFLVCSLTTSRNVLADDECPCPIPKSTSPWTSSASFGFNMAQGNADTFLLTLGPKATYEKDEHILNMSFDFRYGEADDEKNISDIRGSISYKYLLDDRWYALVGEDAVRDEIATIDYRSISYPALGYFLVKDETMKLSVDLGPAATFQRLKGTGDEFFFAYRAGEGFEWIFDPDNKKSKLFQTASYIQSTEDSNEFIVNAKLGVQAKLAGALSISQTIENSFINQPAAGKKRNDILVLTALIFTF